MANFVRAANPIWFFVDLIGEPLNDEYYISFLTNTFPYIPQVIYRDNQGLVPWSDPVQFLSNGTLPDNLYFNDSQVFRLEVRHGNTQDDALIYEVNDFIPGNGDTANTETGTEDNQISNPQFSQINFVSPLVITVAGTYNIAPDWYLELAGSGTATITQLIFSGDQNLEDAPAPPYAIRIKTESWTTAILYQRFNGNGAIWSNEFVSMSLLARTVNGISNSLTLVYKPNTPGAPLTLGSSVLTSGFSIIQGIKAVPESVNSTLNDAAYVDMQIVLPPIAGEVDISNVQVMGQVELIPIDFAQTPAETLERQMDHLFNYYQPALSYKQLPNYLVAWDFPLNPAQFFGPTVSAQATGNNKSFYAWDSTIVFQSLTNGVTIARDTAGAFTLTAAGTVQLALVQYLDQAQARKLLNQILSLNLCAYTTKSGGLPITVSLWYTSGASLPNVVGSNDSIVATLDANGKPATFNGSWTELKTTNGQTLTATIENSSGSVFTDYPFVGYNLNNVVSNTVVFFALVIGTSAMAAADTLHFNSINLCAGSIPTRPAPETADEVLRKCQYFYEKSYDNSVAPGTVTETGKVEIFSPLQYVGAQFELFPQSFNYQFNTVKRIAPVFTVYSPGSGASSSVQALIYLAPAVNVVNNGVSIGNWSVNINGTKEIHYLALNPNTFLTSTGINPADQRMSGSINFHYTADSRLGI